MRMPAPLWYLWTHPMLGEGPLGKEWVVFQGPPEVPHSNLPFTSLVTPWPSMATIPYETYISAVFASSGSALDTHPHANTLWICQASSEDHFGSWTFSLCKMLALSWANWRPGDRGFREGIHSRSALMESSTVYWLQWISLRPWHICASCMKLGWRSQNCKTSSQIPAGMRNLATWHSPLFTPLNYFPC